MSDSRALTTWEALTRSALLSLGLDQALIDFLECTAIGVAAVLLTLTFVGARIPRSLPRRN